MTLVSPSTLLTTHASVSNLTEPNKMKPHPSWAAWIDILPWDVISDFREQVFNGFGLRRKMQKKNRSPKSGVGAVTSEVSTLTVMNTHVVENRSTLAAVV